MRIIKFFGKMFIALFLLFLIFWVILLGTLQTSRGQEWAFNQVIDYLEQTTQTQIQVKDFHFSFPLNLSLEGVTISQDHHPLLTMQHLEICCAYTKLLQGRMVVSRLHASNLDLFKLPQASQTSLPENSHAWDTLLLPFYVKFENIEIQKLRLKPGMIEGIQGPPEIKQMIQQADWNLHGFVSNNPFKSALAAHILITAKSAGTDLTPFSLAVDAQNHQLSLSFHFNSLPLQRLQPDLPSHLKAHLALYASAPIATWQRLAQNLSQANEPIEGHFKLTLDTTVEDPSWLSPLIGQQTVLRSRYFFTSLHAIDLFDLHIDNSTLSLKGRAILTADGVIEQGHFQGKIHQLQPFQAWIGKEMAGTLAFETHAAGPLLSPQLVFHLNSPSLVIAQQVFQNIHSTLQVKPHNKTLNGFLALSFDYQGLPWKANSSFDWNEQQRLTLSHLQIDAIRSHLQGEMTCLFPDCIWEGFLEAHTGNLQDLSHWLATPLNGEGKLKIKLTPVEHIGHRKRQAFDVDVIGQTLHGKDWQAQQVALHLRADPLKERDNFFQIQAFLEGKQLKWKDYAVGQGTAQFSHILDIYHPALSHLTSQWQAQDIRWPTGTVLAASGQIQLQNPLQMPEGQIEFTARQIHTPAMQLQELIGSTSIHPSQSQWPFRLKGQGIFKENLQFAVEGHWHYQQDRWNVQAHALSGRFGSYPLRLKQPVHLAQLAQEMHVSGLWLQWGEAEIQADFHQNQQNIFSRFQTNAIPSTLFHFVTPDLPLAGKATFQGQLEGTFQQPKGQLQIHLHQMQITENIFTNKPLIAGKVFLHLNERGVQLKSELNGVGHTPLLIAGQIPLHFSLNPFNLKFDSHLPFHLDLNAEGELDPYLHLFYNDISNLSGHAKLALKVDGQLDAPQIKGHIDLINGSYESLSTGALYHNIQAHLEGNGSKILLTKLFAQDNKNGQISATGVVHLDASKQFPFEFQIHPSRIFILDSDYVDISASGKLNLSGTTKKSKLQGELTVDQASVHLEEALPRQIKNIEIKYFNIAQNHSLPQYVEKHEANSPVELEVKLHTLQNIRIEGNHLKSEWKGSLSVTGTPENPQLNGDLRIAQGEYDFNGKVFTLTQGNIHFAGAPDKKTSLYIVASKDIDRIKAEIIVKGPANKPAISFRSNPPLSQREVLSYILFNRGISDITPDQGDQLSQSFISLNSNDQTKNSDDFLSRLRNNIGIDRLDFIANDNKENRDFGLQVGKHLTENVTVSVNQSVTSLSPIIAVEAQLRKNIKAQAEAGVAEDAPIRMSIKWKKDY